MEGGKIKLSGEFNKIHIFMRWGQIFPYQSISNKFIPNSNALRKEKTQLYIIPDIENHYACDDIIFDNDEHDTLSTGNYYYIHFDFYVNSITFSVNKEMNTAYEYKDIYISKLKFFRMKYLIEKENYDIARVEFRNGKVTHVLIDYLSDDSFEFDLTENNIRFHEVNRVTLIKNN